MGEFGMFLRFPGHQAVGSHFLWAGERSVIQQALAGLEILMPISASNMPTMEKMHCDGKKLL